MPTTRKLGRRNWGNGEDFGISTATPSNVSVSRTAAPVLDADGDVVMNDVGDEGGVDGDGGDGADEHLLIEAGDIESLSALVWMLPPRVTNTWSFGRGLSRTGRRWSFAVGSKSGGGLSRTGRRWVPNRAVVFRALEGVAACEMVPQIRKDSCTGAESFTGNFVRHPDVHLSLIVQRIPRVHSVAHLDEFGAARQGPRAGRARDGKILAQCAKSRAQCTKSPVITADPSNGTGPTPMGGGPPVGRNNEPRATFTVLAKRTEFRQILAPSGINPTSGRSRCRRAAWSAPPSRHHVIISR